MYGHYQGTTINPDYKYRAKATFLLLLSLQRLQGDISLKIFSVNIKQRQQRL